MSTYLAIAWDENQLLLLAAKTHGKRVVFDCASSVSLRTPNDQSGIFRAISSTAAKVIPESVENHILEFVKKHRLAKSETVFVVGRSDVEVRTMSFPPIPNEELPDAIRFQASKEFNRYELNTPLDFFLLKGLGEIEDVSKEFSIPTSTGISNTETRNSSKNGGKGGGGNANPQEEFSTRTRVLASIIRGELLREIRSLCESANLNLRKVVLHPCEATFLMHQDSQFRDDKTYLFVEIDPTEVLITILYKGQPVFMRSPRLFGERAERTKITNLLGQLHSEIKRTIIAARNEIHRIAIDQVVLLGGDGEHQRLADELSKALSLPVSVFDPWKNVQRGGELEKSLPDSPEHYTALIGTTLLTARNKPSDIDFLNPKRRPPDLSKKRLFTLLSTAACVFVIFAFAFGFWRNYSAEQEMKKLDARSRQLVEESKLVEADRKLLNSIDDWELNHFDWLAQLEWLSRKAPSSQGILLTNIEMKVPMKESGKITLKGNAQNIDVVSQTSAGFWDETHQSSSGSLSTGANTKTPSNPKYPQPFDITITVLKKGQKTAPPSPQSGDSKNGEIQEDSEPVRESEESRESEEPAGNENKAEQNGESPEISPIGPHSEPNTEHSRDQNAGEEGAEEEKTPDSASP